MAYDLNESPVRFLKHARENCKKTSSHAATRMFLDAALRRLEELIKLHSRYTCMQTLTRMQFDILLTRYSDGENFNDVVDDIISKGEQELLNDAT